MLLKVENGIRSRLIHSFNRHVKPNKKYMKDYNRNKESSYLKYWNVNNLYSWAMSQKFPVNDFKWVEDISEFDESFIKIYDEESDEGYFLEVDVHYAEKINDLRNDLPFLPE